MKPAPLLLPPQELFSHSISWHRRVLRLLLMGLLALSALCSAKIVPAADAPHKAPDPRDSSRRIREWKSADGVVYVWRGPTKYDSESGVGLTLVLHGYDLSHT